MGEPEFVRRRARSLFALPPPPTTPPPPWTIARGICVRVIGGPICVIDRTMCVRIGIIGPVIPGPPIWSGHPRASPPPPSAAHVSHVLRKLGFLDGLAEACGCGDGHRLSRRRRKACSHEKGGGPDTSDGESAHHILLVCLLAEHRSTMRLVKRAHRTSVRLSVCSL